ncbi:antimicrobial response protein [Lithospermum erythrorhizon]|uniref:Antimicrobial response protein n=1 Tax=Lithospermum erythrorhizon TaxID=34254 RepID=A0AAV3Q8P2_LITER
MVVDKNQRKRGNEERPRFDIPSDMMMKMDYLRVLMLCDCGIVELPKTIELLEHLRCLNLSHNPIGALPDEVCKLLALQILKLRKCNNLEELPKCLTSLVNLHQLDIDIGNLKKKSLQLGKLTALQFLEEFFVQDMDGHRIEELGNMRFLEGSLKISNLEKVCSFVDASKAKLKEKPYLNALKFNWSEVVAKADMVLDGLQPHRNLQELSISKYGGSSFPGCFNQTKPRLSRLCLDDLPNCEDLPWLGQLTLLKSLHIINMPKLRELAIAFSGNVDGGFRRLESLLFSQLPMFAKWDRIFDHDLPCLTDLTFKHCPKLKELPKGKFALKRLEISKCDILKQRCIKGGEDWPIVRNIEKVVIDERDIK